VTPFVLNLLFAIGWGALTGNFSLANLTAGFVLGFVALWVAYRLQGGAPYFGRIGKVVAFVGFFVWELVVANLRVARTVLAPRIRIRPRIVEIPLDLESDHEITILANLITLTPGTLSLDVSEDRKTLLVHALDVEDEDAFRREIKDGFERRVREVLR
jgi:multicomponent Na+:H+ antiporter subunit E